MKKLLYKEDGETREMIVSDIKANSIANAHDNKKSWDLEDQEGIWKGTYNRFDFVGIREYKQKQLNEGSPGYFCDFGVYHKFSEYAYGKCNCGEKYAKCNAPEFWNRMQKLGYIIIGGLVNEKPITKQMIAEYRAKYLTSTLGD